MRDLSEEQQAMRKEKGMLDERKKDLTKGQLQEKWAAERRERRFGPPSDELLTEEEKALPRRVLQRKLAEDSHKQWVERQRAFGNQLVPCTDCGRLKLINDARHFCFRPQWRLPVDRRAGIAQQQEVVITGTTGGIKLGRQVVVDPAELDKRLEYLNKLKA